MLQTRIFLLGGLAILRERDNKVELTGKRGPALVAYLARSPGMAATRERLASLLWADSGTARARNNLRQTLSVLRQDLARAGIDIISSHKDVVSLKAKAIDVDVAKLEAGFGERSAHELETALALFSGPFLDGFSLGSDAFDDWVVEQRERLSNRVIESLERLARLVDAEKGLTLADRLLAMEPTREASYRLRLELLVILGQRDAAIRTYQACRKMLKKEFGVEVSQKTQEIARSLFAAGDSKGAAALPQEPSIAVQPARKPERPTISVAGFVNLTGERRDDYFARGLAQDIVTALLQRRDCIVVTGNPPRASFRWPGGDGNAHYVMNGTTQRAGSRVRVNVQLVDMANNHIVWAQRFDDQSRVSLGFQDQISRSIALALGIELQLTGRKALDKSPPGPAEVRRLVNEAVTSIYEMTRDSLLSAMDLAERALGIAPENPRAKRTVSIATSLCLAFGSVPRNEASVLRPLQLAEDAVEIVPGDEIARCILSFALEAAGRIDEAIVECRHAIGLNPHYSIAHGDLAELYALRGQVDEALHEVSESFRLGGLDITDFWRHHAVVLAKFADCDDHRALESARKVVRSKPGFVRGALYWAATAAATGHDEEASRAIHHCLEQLPTLTIANVSPGFVPRYVSDHHHHRFLDLLSRAGLPEV